MTTLVIVESPKKAYKIQQFLGKAYTVVACCGHVVDLPAKVMGVNTANGSFDPTYSTLPGKTKILGKLRSLVKSSNGSVVLATDPDVEGEAMAWHLAKLLKLNSKSNIRAQFREISSSAVLHALANATAIDERKVEMQIARRVLDRIIGYSITPLLWNAQKHRQLACRTSSPRSKQDKLSAGRVMSAALKMIYLADHAAATATSRITWTVKANLQFPLKDLDMHGSLISADQATWDNEQDVEQVLQSMCAHGSLQVWDIHWAAVYDKAPAPFTTSTLQQCAAKQLHTSLSRTMQLAQDLYEGGLITYMRTDSTRLSAAAVHDLGNQVCSLYGGKYHVARQWNTNTERAQDAHEAIRPVNPSMGPGGNYITPEHSKLYSLIWKRAIASQMCHAEYSERTVLTSGDMCAEGLGFVSSNRYLQNVGYLQVYGTVHTVICDINSIVVGDHVLIKHDKLSAMPTASNIARRLDCAGLVRRMETTGVGRPSTYAPTITKLINSGMAETRDYRGDDMPAKTYDYCVESGKLSSSVVHMVVGAERARMVPTQLGSAVIKWLEGSGYGWLLEPAFTGEVENRLDLVTDVDGRRILLQDIWARMSATACM